MTKLILVRHGETEWNVERRFQGQSDIALSEVGREQAKQLAERFPLRQVDSVYSSDLSRARETAAQIAQKFGCEVHPEADLREMNFGEWEGLSHEEIHRRWPEAESDLWLRPDLLCTPGGETVQQVQERAMQTIDRILATEPEDSAIVIVAHGAVIRSILCAMLHIPLRYFWSIRQDNTAISVAQRLEGKWFIELVNSTAHLDR